MENPKGLTNKVTLTNDILKKVSSKDVDYFLNRKAEESLYNQLKNVDNDSILKPLKWGFNSDNTFYSEWKYIPNTFTFMDKPLLARDKDTQLKIIKLVKEYHSIKVDMPIFNPYEYLQMFRTKIKQPLVDLSEFEDTLKLTIKEHFDLSKDKLVLSHNDMVPGNFLFNENYDVKLIDFEYSMLNNYLFDFAGFITETLPQDCEEEFIKLVGLTDKEVKELRYLIFYAYILWINWSNYMYEVRHDEVYKQLVFFMFNRLINDEKLKNLEI